MLLYHYTKPQFIDSIMDNGLKVNSNHLSSSTDLINQYLQRYEDHPGYRIREQAIYFYPSIQTKYHPYEYIYIAIDSSKLDPSFLYMENWQHVEDLFILLEEQQRNPMKILYKEIHQYAMNYLNSIVLLEEDKLYSNANLLYIKDIPSYCITEIDEKPLSR